MALKIDPKKLKMGEAKPKGKAKAGAVALPKPKATSIDPKKIKGLK